MSENMDLMLDSEYARAMTLHQEILAGAQLICNGIVQFSRAINEMHEDKLYKKMNWDTFEDYVEQSVGLGRRQAYRYLTAYKKLGPEYLEENKKLGITKLELLASLEQGDLEDVAKDQDLAGMTVAEVKALVERSKKQEDDIARLETEIKDADNGAEVWKKEAERLREEAEAKDAKLEELTAAPIETGDVPAGADELEAARQEAREEALAETAETIEKAAAEAAEKARAEMAEQLAQLEKQLAENEKRVQEEAHKAACDARAEERAAASEELARQRQESEDAAKRAEALEKELKLASSKESVAFSLWFDQVQQAFARMLEQVAAVRDRGDAEEAEKYTAAGKKLLEVLAAQLE